MRRREFLAGFAAARTRQAEPHRPNIIFILADDLGWGDLGCYGHRELKTPNLDRLAREGTLFTQFYTAASVCSPSRAGFLTGRFPARDRIHHAIGTKANNQARGNADFLDPGLPCLPRTLKEAGYATGHFGKWHLGSGQGAPPPSAYGFDESRSVNGNDTGWPDANEIAFRSRSDSLIVDEVLRFAEKNKETPFYAQYWSIVPHAVLFPSTEQLSAYAHLSPAGKDSRIVGAKQYFYASVTAMDAQIGRLIRGLDRLGLTGRTLILFSSDNGPEEIQINMASHSAVGSPGPFRGRKRSIYEGGIRVPFIARCPGLIPAGRVENSTPICAVDFHPSLARLAGADAPQGDGEDMIDVLKGASRTRRTRMFWEWRHNIPGHVNDRSPMLAIREGPWKLLANPDGSRKELYRIDQDPSERENLTARHPDRVSRLFALLAAWREELPPSPVHPNAGKNDYPWPKP